MVIDRFVGLLFGFNALRNHDIEPFVFDVVVSGRGILFFICFCCFCGVTALFCCFDATVVSAPLYGLIEFATSHVIDPLTSAIVGVVEVGVACGFIELLSILVLDRKSVV